MQNLLIQKEQRDALLVYLQEKPWREVNAAIAWLQRLEPAPNVPATPAEAVGFFGAHAIIAAIQQHDPDAIKAATADKPEDDAAS